MKQLHVIKRDKMHNALIVKTVIQVLGAPLSCKFYKTNIGQFHIREDNLSRAYYII